MKSKYCSNSSRRELLKILTLLPAFAFLSCSDNEEKRRLKNVLEELHFYGTGTLDIKEHWDQSRKDINVKVLFDDNGNDIGPILNKMISGTAAYDYDIGGLQGGAERELAEAGAIIPWDLKKIPNFDKLWSWAKDIPYTQVNGQQYGLPIVINADSIIYLPEKIGEIDSYSSIFDPKFKGKVAMEDSWMNSVIFTAIYLKENGIEKIVDPGNLELDELKAVMEFLIQKKKEGQFRTFWSGWEEGLKLIMDEDVYMMTGWEPIVYAAKAQGKNVKYAVPREGYEGWSNDLVLHKGAEKRGNIDTAHKFANWELSGYYGCKLGQMRGYAVPSDLGIDYAEKNSNICDVIEYVKLLTNVKEKFLSQKGAIYWQNVRPKNFKAYEDWWSKLRVC